jgi:Sigma-70 region 2
MASVASQRATAALATGGTAAESLSLELRCYSKNTASPHNKVADSLAGKAAQFEREVVPLRELLYRHALHMCQNHDDAEDLVQETMVKGVPQFSFLCLRWQPEGVALPDPDEHLHQRLSPKATATASLLDGPVHRPRAGDAGATYVDGARFGRGSGSGSIA